MGYFRLLARAIPTDWDISRLTTCSCDDDDYHEYYDDDAPDSVPALMLQSMSNDTLLSQALDQEPTKHPKHELLGGISLPHCYAQKGDYGIAQPYGPCFGAFFKTLFELALNPNLDTNCVIRALVTQIPNPKP